MTVPALCVRCFALDDDGLVDEWPVSLGLEEVCAFVPAAKADPELREPVPVDEETAGLLLGHPVEPAGEPVVYYVERVDFAALAGEDAAGDDGSPRA